MDGASAGWSVRLAEIALITLGFATSAGAFFAIRKAERVRIHAEFERESRRSFDLVRRELAASTEVIAGYAAHLAVDRSGVCRSRGYAQAALKRHPSLRGLSWNTLVPLAERASFEAEQAATRPGFRITERNQAGELLRAADRDSYMVVTCIEPEQGNEKAIGFDLQSEPTRAKALANTLASRAPAATAKIRLVQETANAAAVLVVHVVTDPVTGGPVGSASAVLRIDEIFARTVDTLPPGVTYALVDRGAASEAPLFSVGAEPTPGEVTVELAVDVADRPWLLRASAQPGALDARRSWEAFAWLGVGLFVTFLGVRVVRSQRAARELLRNVMPDNVAERLEQGERVADRHEDVTVLFADIASFTPIAAELPPNEVVRLLDDLFSQFDHISDTHGLEKIKTIGDCYMCVAGLDQAPNATFRVVRAGLEMVAAAESRNLTLRIGVHRGPVVCGVIGRRRLAYDLWGDTVNIASRMETFGVPGQVALSEDAYAALEGHLPCEPREPISMKGVGMRSSWLVPRTSG